jgi:integrase
LTALESLYGHYVKTYDLWQKAGITVPPCFIIVCNNTATSKLVYDYVSGFHRQNKDGSTTLENGRLALFRNFDDVTGNPLPRPNTLLIDSDREPANARLHLPLFILLGLYTGARKEAILSLRWSQVDLNAGRINYNLPGARQTKKKRAHIPIPARLLAHLRRASLRGVEMGFVVNIGGKRIGDIKRGFGQACRRAGLKYVTPHTLRHTAATWLMQHGVNVWDAAGFLGMSPETLQKVYGHHHPDYLKSAAEAYG